MSSYISHDKIMHHHIRVTVGNIELTILFIILRVKIPVTLKNPFEKLRSTAPDLAIQI